MYITFVYMQITDDSLAHNFKKKILKCALCFIGCETNEFMGTKIALAS